MPTVPNYTMLISLARMTRYDILDATQANLGNAQINLN